MVCIIILFIHFLLRAFGLEGFVVSIEALSISATLELFLECMVMVYLGGR